MALKITIETISRKIPYFAKPLKKISNICQRPINNMDMWAAICGKKYLPCIPNEKPDCLLNKKSHKAKIKKFDIHDNCV